MAIPLIPTTGNTITFINPAYNTGSYGNASITVNAPASSTVGDFDIAFISNYTEYSYGAITPPAGWYPCPAINSSNQSFFCLTHVVTASDGSSFVFRGAPGGYTQIGIVAYRNVQGIDSPITVSGAAIRP